MHGTTTSRRRALGELIRQARTAAGLTQHGLARLLDCGQAKINKMETGAVGVKRADLDLLVGILRVDRDLAEQMKELLQANERGARWDGHRAAVPRWFRAFTDLEPTARDIFAWHGERIPGLLQSELYMLEQFTMAGARDVKLLLRNRLERKKVLDQENPPQYHFILSEAAFRRMIGGLPLAVALDQVQYLLALDLTHPHLHLHALPFAADVLYVPNDYTIMTFANTTKDCVFLEYLEGGDDMNSADEVERFVRNWDGLREASLTEQDTRGYLTGLERELVERRSTGSR
ncbi:helix-turn-helix domain-containing protein [Solihabitans fulvus]|uniref:Helix-turn-helix domain-containing protein n=1 Tax=Solihabitans fulvus TaxID=1892852 RepID=A0A5B2XV62_9PSEU|nr:helix-turn-helix transcriptional regulator [Solihabitans fulvus]KAA2267193.1 helix-turn-helix domain-containing protein [Solihabitans fulvus]